MNAMKLYKVGTGEGGGLFWYREGEQPEGATEVKQGKPANKGKAAANKDASQDKADKQPAEEKAE